MSRALKLLFPIASAILFQLAFPPINLRLLVLVCLVPWLIRLGSDSRRAAFGSGYLMGFLIVLAQMFWIVPFVSKWTHSAALAMIPWILCGLIGAFYFAFTGVLIRSCLLRRLYWAIPLIWAGTEVVRSFIIGLAFPWFIIAMPLGQYPALDQLSFFGTVYLVSAWVVLCNLCIYLWWKDRRSSGVKVYAGVAAAMLLLSLGWYLRPTHGNPVRLTVGQPGWDMAFGDLQARDQQIAMRVATLEKQAIAAHSSLLILPEGLVEGGDFPPHPLFPLPDSLPVLFGATRGRQPAFQSAILYRRGRWSYADKSRLVVFGEYVPGRDYLSFLKGFNLPSGDLAPADKVSAIHVGSLTVGPMLCFEGLFYDVAHAQSENGSQVLAVMSIDDWYMGTAAPEQLRDAIAWRAMETGLPVVRAASLGYSLMVDQKGRVTGEIPLGASDSLTQDVLIEEKPLRNPFLPVFPWVAGLSPFAFALLFATERKRRAYASRASAKN
jgi:apolipoprotein N-acyltransferase